MGAGPVSRDAEILRVLTSSMKPSFDGVIIG
jgi:hypothetical protein